MAKASKNYMRHLRWVAARLFLTVNCEFCGKPLFDSLLEGKAAWWSITKRVTIHHRDHNHDNDSPGNLAPCHTECHRRYHMLEARGEVERTKAA
jgi:hypothetical protein